MNTKVTKLICCLSVFMLVVCACGIASATAPRSEDPAAAFSAAEEPVAAASAVTRFTSGQQQSGSFGMITETAMYEVYLQANKKVAFSAWGSSSGLQSVSVYSPSGTLVGNVSTVASGSLYRYATLTMPNTSGYYKIYLTGALGASYTVNCLTGIGTTSNTNTVYNRGSAAIYAQQYALGHNPDYPLYSADCTNFVSQCVHVGGGMPMITGGTTDAYWHYTGSSNRSPSWAGADYFLRHWTKVRLSSYYGKAYSVNIYTKEYVLSNWSTFYSNTNYGDILQYLSANDSNAYHSAAVVGKTSDNTTILFASHSSVQNTGSLKTYINDQVDDRQWIVVIRISSN